MKASSRPTLTAKELLEEESRFVQSLEEGQFRNYTSLSVSLSVIQSAQSAR